MYYVSAIIIPVCICVILPIVIIWIVFNSINNRTNRQSDIILEAIKANPNVDSEKLIESFQKKEATPWMSLNRKLLRGSIFTLMGIAFALLAIFFPDADTTFGCWVVCGCVGAVGIGFLISYWFGYAHIDKFMEEKVGNHKSR